MPELPEVETIVRELGESHIIGKKVTHATVYWPRTVATQEPKEFAARIVGQTIKSVSRRGKFIVIGLDKDVLLIHLRMTGKLSYTKSREVKSSHERLQLGLSDGRMLHYEDQRKFGKWYLLKSAEEKFAELGLEPLSDEFTFEAFKGRIKKSSVGIKAYLLNQKHVVGLGNIYVDEALWESKIHPMQSVNSLSAANLKALYPAIIKVLKTGVSNHGTTLGNANANYFSVSGHKGGNQTHLKVFRREGESCPRCGTELIKLIVAQRGTHICPTCQVLR